MKKLIVYTTLAMVLIVGSYQFVSAKPGNGSGNGSGHGSRTTQSVSYVEKLKLTDDQVSKISVLIQKDNASSKLLHEKMQTSMNALREMEWSKNFLQANADQLVKDIADARTAVQSNHQKLYADIKALLTADQQKLFDELGFAGCGSGGTGTGSGSGCGKGRGKGCGRN